LVAMSLLQDIKKRLENLFGERFRGLVLYGSFARGDARHDSDIDALCLLEEEFSGDLWKITEALYPLQLENPESELHIIPVDFAEYQAGDFALFREVRREGMVI